MHSYQVTWSKYSEVRFNSDYGAMRIEASAMTLTFEYLTRDGELIDRYTVPE